MNRSLEYRCLRPAVLPAVVLLLACANAWSNDHGGATTLALLKAKGLKGFVDAIKTNRVAPLSIPSNKSCEAIADPEKRKLVQQDRELGLAILRETASLNALPFGSELHAIDDALALRSWCLERQSYGNLVLASVAEETAVTLLLRSLAAPDGDLEQIRPRVEACCRDSPTSAYWLQMLDQEKQPINSANIGTPNDPDYIRLAAIIETLLKDKADASTSAVYPGSGGDYEACYAAYDPAQVGWLVTTLSIRKSALAACLAMKEKMGALPENREEFRTAVKQNAAAIIRKQDRLGGRIDSGQVWIIWREALSM
ncbi:MAG: hypothetical protein ACOX5G_07425 [Kiritimatiellia bacterium]|jgi:hypothetical protein